MQTYTQMVGGYRELTGQEAALINEIKASANNIGSLCNRLAALAKGDAAQVDPRWVAVGQTDLQKGFMALIRAVAKPTGF